MIHSHTAHFQIRHSELNAYEEVSNRVLAHLFQETAMDASTSAGYGLHWYDEHHTVWVIREMTLEHLRPVYYHDELDVTTWLASMQRVRARREYLARNAATGEVVARGSASWAYIDRRTLFPVRIPPDVLVGFEPSGIRVVPHAQPRVYPLPPGLPGERVTTRQVQHYEADAMQHVNNGIYLDWLEEPLVQMTSPSRRLCVRRHDVEYVRGALPGDQVTLVTRLAGAGRCVTVWAQELTRGADVVARNRLTAFWADLAGRPVPWIGSIEA